MKRLKTFGPYVAVCVDLAKRKDREGWVTTLGYPNALQHMGQSGHCHILTPKGQRITVNVVRCDCQDQQP